MSLFQISSERIFVGCQIIYTFGSIEIWGKKNDWKFGTFATKLMMRTGVGSGWNSSVKQEQRSYRVWRGSMDFFQFIFIAFSENEKFNHKFSANFERHRKILRTEILKFGPKIHSQNTFNGNWLLLRFRSPIRLLTVKQSFKVFHRQILG